LLLRRSVDLAGKSRAWVNGSPATAQQLRAVGELLLDIHGQHAWQSLTRAAAVRALLDAYAQVSTTALSRHWQTWQAARNAHADALAAQSNLQDQRDKLLWQISEVDKLQPQPDEWDSLNTEHGRLSNGQTLLDAAQSALDALDGDDGGALGRLNTACAAVEPQQGIESRFAEPAQMLNAALAQTEETVRTLRAYLRHVDLDPARLHELDTRMALWVSLARRYKQTPAQLCATWQQWKQELAQLDNARINSNPYQDWRAQNLPGTGVNYAIQRPAWGAARVMTPQPIQHSEQLGDLRWAGQVGGAGGPLAGPPNEWVANPGLAREVPRYPTGQPIGNPLPSSGPPAGVEDLRSAQNLMPAAPDMMFASKVEGHPAEAALPSAGQGASPGAGGMPAVMPQPAGRS
jgi:hypothetical protein